MLLCNICLPLSASLTLPCFAESDDDVIIKINTGIEVPLHDAGTCHAKWCNESVTCTLESTFQWSERAMADNDSRAIMYLPLSSVHMNNLFV